MTNLAIIIARAGSKGLRGKHNRMLGGKPLIAWTIEHALGSSCIDQVLVSSDDPQVLDTAQRMHVEAYDRPAELASDSATVDAAVRHAMRQWEAKHARQCDHVAILYGAVALRPRDLTDRAIDKLTATGADSVQTVYQVQKVHPYWLRKLVGQGADQVEPYTPNRVYRRQDLPPLYMLSSGVLAVTRQSLLQEVEGEPHAFLGTDRRAVVVDEMDVVDVDTELDLLLAQTILQYRQGVTDPAARGADLRVQPHVASPHDEPGPAPVHRRQTPDDATRGEVDHMTGANTESRRRPGSAA